MRSFRFFSSSNCLKTLTRASAAALLLGSLAACGTDMLTYAQDSKTEGMKEYSDGKYAEAAGSFRNAIRQDPTDPVSEYWLAQSYEKVGALHEAIDAYKTSLALMPPSWSARYDKALHDSAFDRLARVVAESDSSGAEVDLMAKDAAASKSAEQYRLLGRIFRYRGDADSALEAYRQAVALNPQDFVAQKELGLYLEKLNQNQEAGVTLRDAYRLNQKDHDVNVALQRIGMTPGPTLLAQETPAAAATPSAMVPPSSDIGSGIGASDQMAPSQDTAMPRD